MVGVMLKIYFKWAVVPISFFCILSLLSCGNHKTGSGQYPGLDNVFIERATPQQLDAAIRAGKDPNAAYLSNGVPNDMGAQAIFATVNSNRPNLIRVLLAHGADINSRDAHGRTPLITAAISGNLIMLGSLLENGANPNVVSPKWGSALHAVRHSSWVASETRGGLSQLEAVLKHYGATDIPPAAPAAP